MWKMPGGSRDACTFAKLMKFGGPSVLMDFIKQPTLDFPVGSNSAARLQKNLEQ
jgi:hypothetical protein